MDERIKREAAMEAANEWVREACKEPVMRVSRLFDKLKQVPAADVAPVVHGRWDNSGRYTFPGGGTAVRCTNCGCALTESKYRLNNWNYCPVCGAMTYGGADHEDD